MRLYSQYVDAELKSEREIPHYSPRGIEKRAVSCSMRSSISCQLMTQSYIIAARPVAAPAALCLLTNSRTNMFASLLHGSSARICRPTAAQPFRKRDLFALLRLMWYARAAVVCFALFNNK